MLFFLGNLFCIVLINLKTGFCIDNDFIVSISSTRRLRAKVLLKQMLAKTDFGLRKESENWELQLVKYS